MWFLKFWGISTAIVLLMLWILKTGIEEQVKREYPEKYKPKKTGFFEKASNLMIMFIPVINIVLLLAGIWGREKMLKSAVETLTK